MSNYSVFIGRFQPFHKGHLHVVKEALKQSEKLIMVIGSCGGPRTTRNPLTFDERVRVIQSSLPPEELSRVIFSAVPDFTYNDNQWIASVQQAVFSAIHREKFIAGPYTVALAGMNKDESSYYLNLFPQWDSITVETPSRVISSTDIRNGFFRGDGGWTSDMMRFAAQDFADLMLPVTSKLESDWKYEQEYETKWGKGPHFTADACVVQSGHILLIQRGAEYGQGQWALPGGFVNAKEKAFDASVRELYEETKIKVPEKVIRGSVVKSMLFDNPYRSNRSRIITQATYFQLSNMDLPKVTGSDDAQDAKWVPLAEVKVMRHSMFEDHHDIISTLTGAF